MLDLATTLLTTEPQHTSASITQASAYAYGAYPPAVQSRRIGLGAGVNLGPLGAGASAGIGQGQIGFSGVLGFGGNYANYGTRPHYSQYYVNPNRQPWFNPNQLYY